MKMREIKFRVLHKPTNTIFVQLEDSPCFGKFEGDRAVSIEDVFFYEKQDFEIMQYTGLKDKNGKEIYEGDIDSDDHNNLSVICYIEKYGAYCAVPLELYLHEDYENEVVYEYGYDCYFHNCTPEKYLNIIGNIYENPELLEESK